MQTNQIQIENNIVILKVKQVPKIILGIFFTLAFLFFLMPLLSIVLAIYFRVDFQIGFLVIAFLFGIMGFFLLRLALWNTYGEEKMTFTANTLDYQADYRWFKGAVKQVENKGLEISIQSVEADEEDVGVLVFTSEEDELITVIKLPISELEIALPKMEELLAH